MEFRVIKKSVQCGYIIGFGVMSVFFCVAAIINTAAGNVGMAILFSVFALFPLVLLLWTSNRASHRLVVDECGVTYRKKNAEYFIPWNEMGEVEVVSSRHRFQIGGARVTQIWFERRGSSKLEGFGENAFCAQYSKELDAAIEKYRRDRLAGNKRNEKNGGSKK